MTLNVLGNKHPSKAILIMFELSIPITENTYNDGFTSVMR